MSPRRVVLSDEQRRERAEAILAAAEGLCDSEMAERLGRSRLAVSRWRKCFCGEGLRGVEGDLGRVGRVVFAPAQRAEVRALACALPVEKGVSLARWSGAELAIEAASAGSSRRSAAVTVRRWLTEDAVAAGYWPR